MSETDELTNETFSTDTKHEEKDVILAKNNDITTGASIEEIQDRLTSLFYLKYSKIFNYITYIYNSIAFQVSKTFQYISQIYNKTPSIVKLLIGALISCIFSYFTQIPNSGESKSCVYYFIIFVFLSYISFFWISNEMILSSVMSCVLAPHIILSNLKTLKIEYKTWVCVLMYPIQYALIRKPIQCRFTQYFPLVIFITPIYFFICHLDGYSFLAIVPFATNAVFHPILENYLSGLRFYDCFKAYDFIKQLSMAINVAIAFIATFVFALIFSSLDQFKKIDFEEFREKFDVLLVTPYIFALLISGISQNKFYLFSALIMLFVRRDAFNNSREVHATIDALCCLAFGTFESIRDQNNFYFKYIALFVFLLMSFVKF